MATATTSTSTAYFTTDAGFRTMGSAIGTAITSVNLIKTSDTGQINWTTVLHPTTQSTVSGYEVYRFNDYLQSTSPVYIKIEYGCGSYAVGYMGLWITVGTGTDGAGNLTGNISQRVAIASSAIDTNTRTSYFSGDVNRLCFVLWPQNPANMSSQWLVFGIERSHNASGVDTGTAAHIFWSSATSPFGSCQYLLLGTTTNFITPYVSQGWYCSIPPSGGGSLSPNLYSYPIKSYNMYETLPIFNFVHFAGTDFATGSTFSITGYDSVSRTYYVPGMVNTNAGYFAFTGAPLTTALLMRYE